jgi:hypothetical protein
VHARHIIPFEASGCDMRGGSEAQTQQIHTIDIFALKKSVEFLVCLHASSSFPGQGLIIDEMVPRRRLLPVSQLGAIEVLVLVKYCNWGLDAARPRDASIQGSRHAFRNDGMPPLWPHGHGPAAAFGRPMGSITSRLGVCGLVLRGGSAAAHILKSAI